MLVVTATAAVVGGAKELLAPSYAEGRLAWADEKKKKFLLAFLSMYLVDRQISGIFDTYLGIYIYPCVENHSRKQTTDDDAWCQ